MNKLLLVDDEQHILDALQRELHGLFGFASFTSPESALEFSKRNPVELVIADYKMPGLNGLDFLKQFGQLQPDAARIVLSGEADIDVLLRTINESHIYRFISKPWERSELLSNIQQALSYRHTLLESRQLAATQSAQGAEDSPYCIALVESDPHLLAMMARGLDDESGRDSLYGAMQQELQQSGRPARFCCYVATFRNGHDAIDYISRNRCDLMITSQNLSDMSGTELLSALRKTAPHVARILVDASPNKATVSQAINDAEVQNLLLLHWDQHEPRVDLRRQSWNLYQLKRAAMQALAERELQHPGIRQMALFPAP